MKMLMIGGEVVSEFEFMIDQLVKLNADLKAGTIDRNKLCERLTPILKKLKEIQDGR